MRVYRSSSPDIVLVDILIYLRNTFFGITNPYRKQLSSWILSKCFFAKHHNELCNHDTSVSVRHAACTETSEFFPEYIINWALQDSWILLGSTRGHSWISNKKPATFPFWMRWAPSFSEAWAFSFFSWLTTIWPHRKYSFWQVTFCIFSTVLTLCFLENYSLMVSGDPLGFWIWGKG